MRNLVIPGIAAVAMVAPLAQQAQAISEQMALETVDSYLRMVHYRDAEHGAPLEPYTAWDVWLPHIGGDRSLPEFGALIRVPGGYRHLSPGMTVPDGNGGTRTLSDIVDLAELPRDMILVNPDAAVGQCFQAVYHPGNPGEGLSGLLLQEPGKIALVNVRGQGFSPEAEQSMQHLGYLYDSCDSSTMDPVELWGWLRDMYNGLIAHSVSVDENEELSATFSLLGQNPSRDRATLSLALPEPAYARISVINPEGRNLGRLMEGNLPPGTHVLGWDAGALPSGRYFFLLEVEGSSGRKSFQVAPATLIR
ncbi:MAG: hypothetical protein V1735_00770 [Nanoarchaeota archaeon]